MVGAPSAREEEQARLTGARNEFVASLGRRLEVLRAALASLEEDPHDRKRQHGMLRRVHALASAARVLGFATVAEVLAEAERAVRRATRPGNQALAFQDVARALDLLPSLVLGAPAAPRVLGTDGETRSAEHGYPISVLVFGSPALLSALVGDDPERVDVELTEDAERAREIARSIGPDVSVIDADRNEAKSLVEQLLGDPQVERMPLLVVGSFVSSEAATAFVTLGAERVLPKPVSPETLRRTVFELHELSSRPRPTREPIGEVTVDGLVDRIGQEIRKGLIESVEQGGQSTPVDFAEGADVLGAVWGAVARLRELVTVKSRGAVRFQPYGPEGAIPLAPWSADDRRAGERYRHGRGADDVALRGRKVVVADDDPAVVWFMTSLFKAVGAEVLEAHDGERALERVFESAPDLVVSDVLMPGRDGFSLCHEIKRDVVARDVPVILLSWKEDLLQRVRELGADADGYLRKEAAASTVVERVREVLRPRARIEQRLQAGGESRGRLDGITPRFVLERVCRTSPDSTLTVRDAVYLYELHVRGGHVRTATRTASDGSFERGDRVLLSLLGVSAGRFAVQPDQSACRNDFHEPLEVLLAAPIARARAALAALSAERLSRVTRVGIDLANVGRYLECTPASARQLIEQLADGRAPRDLVLDGEVSPRLLESVLSDLARRGAISGVEREDGTAFRASVRPARPRSQAPSSPEAAPADSGGAAAAASVVTAAPAALAAAPSAEPSANVAPAAPAAPTAPEMPEPSASAAPSPRSPAAEAPSLDVTALDSDWTGAPAPTASSEVKASPDGVSDARVDASTTVAELPTPDHASQSHALDQGKGADADADADRSWFRFQVEPSASAELPPVVPVAPDAHEANAGESAAAEAPSPRTPPEPTPIADSPVDELSPESLSIFAALAEGAVGARPPATRSEPVPDIVPASDDLDAPQLATGASISQTLGGIGPAPIQPAPATLEVAPDAARRRESPPKFTQTLPLGFSTPPLSGPRPPLKYPVEETPSPGMAEVIAAAVAGTDDAESPPAAPSPPSPPSPTAVDTGKTAALDSSAVETPATVSVLEPASDEQLPKTLAEHSAPKSPARAEVKSQAVARDAAGLDATLISEGVPPLAEDSAQPPAAASSAPTPAPASPAKVRSESRPKSSQGRSKTPDPTAKAAIAAPSPPPPQSSGTQRTVLLALLAFAGAFVSVHFVIVPLLEPKEPAEEPAPSASPVVLPSAAAPSRTIVPRLSDLPLPGETPVEPGQGLVEILGSAEDQLYFDGTMIGRGGRRVPAAPGRHLVRVTRGNETVEISVDVVASRMTRVTLAAAPGSERAP